MTAVQEKVIRSRRRSPSRLAQSAAVTKERSASHQRSHRKRKSLLVAMLLVLVPSLAMVHVSPRPDEFEVGCRGTVHAACSNGRRCRNNAYGPGTPAYAGAAARKCRRLTRCGQSWLTDQDPQRQPFRSKEGTGRPAKRRRTCWTGAALWRVIVGGIRQGLPPWCGADMGRHRIPWDVGQARRRTGDSGHSSDPELVSSGYRTGTDGRTTGSPRPSSECPIHMVSR